MSSNTLVRNKNLVFEAPSLALPLIFCFYSLESMFEVIILSITFTQTCVPPSGQQNKSACQRHGSGCVFLCSSSQSVTEFALRLHA
jgi:hypothetical protein